MREREVCPFLGTPLPLGNGACRLVCALDPREFICASICMNLPRQLRDWTQCVEHTTVPAYRLEATFNPRYGDDSVDTPPALHAVASASTGPTRSASSLEPIDAILCIGEAYPTFRGLWRSCARAGLLVGTKNSLQATYHVTSISSLKTNAPSADPRCHVSFCPS